jgi:CRP-like cAMP-binding protein
MKTVVDQRHELRRVYLLSQLDDEQLGQVVSTMQVHLLEKGQRLFDQGQSATRFFLLRQGQIKLYRLSPDGQEKIIEVMRPGQTFAEAVMFMENRVYPVHAETLDPAEVVSFDNGTFLQVLRESVDTCFRLMATMSMRLHAQVTEIENLCLHNATFRLVSYLLQELPAGAEETEVQLSTPKAVIAARLAIQPETFSRILARLRDQGLIEVHGADIVLKDIPGLRRLVCA